MAGKGKSCGNASDGGEVAVDEEADDGHDDECHKGGGHLLGQTREKLYDDNRANTEDEGNPTQSFACAVVVFSNHVHYEHGAFQSDEGIELLEDDDDADTAHETREDGVGDVAYILTDADDAEQYLEKSAEDACKAHVDDDACECCFGVEACLLCCRPCSADDAGGDDGHRARRTADLAVGAAEDGCEESEECGTDKSGKGTHAAGTWSVNAAEGLDAKGKGKWKSHDTGGDTTENVALQIVGRDKCHILYV